MKIQNPFRLGLLAGLGVLVALLIGSALWLALNVGLFVTQRPVY